MTPLKHIITASTILLKVLQTQAEAAQHEPAAEVKQSVQAGFSQAVKSTINQTLHSQTNSAVNVTGKKYTYTWYR